MASLSTFFGRTPRLIAPARVSKHAAKPFEGKLCLNTNSGLRKLMRAANRGEFIPLIPSYEEVMSHRHNARAEAYRLFADQASENLDRYLEGEFFV